MWGITIGSSPCEHFSCFFVSDDPVYYIAAKGSTAQIIFHFRFNVVYLCKLINKAFCVTDSLGMGGSGFGASFGGGITSSGLEMFGQKKPPTSGMLNPAAQQAFQQAAAKPNKQPSTIAWLDLTLL